MRAGKALCQYYLSSTILSVLLVCMVPYGTCSVGGECRDLRFFPPESSHKINPRFTLHKTKPITTMQLSMNAMILSALSLSAAKPGEAADGPVRLLYCRSSLLFACSPCMLFLGLSLSRHYPCYYFHFTGLTMSVLLLSTNHTERASYGLGFERCQVP
jgi:hypothetical protein